MKAQKLTGKGSLAFGDRPPGQIGVHRPDW